MSTISPTLIPTPLHAYNLSRINHVQVQYSQFLSKPSSELMPPCYSSISLKEEQTPERLGVHSTLAVTTCNRTHPTFIPRFSPYYWPDTPTKPPRDRSFPRPLKRQHAKLFVRQSGLPEAELPGVEGMTLSPKSLWLILIYLIDLEFGPQLVLHFSPIQDVDSTYHEHSLGSSKSKIGFIVLGFCEFQP